MSSNNQFTYLNNPDDMKASELIQLILQDHHAYVRSESGILVRLASQAVQESESQFPELNEILVIVKDIVADMDMHQMKEERILFPYIQAMELSIQTGATVPQSCFGDVRNPVRAMENDHANVHELLAQLDVLTNGFTPANNASETIKDLYKRLQQFRDNTFRHVHLENDVLFKKAIDLQGNL